MYNKDMDTNYCNKCGQCCKNITVDFQNNALFWDGVQVLTKEFKEMLIINSSQNNYSICSCKYLKDNLCTNPQKPDICKNYPSNPFAFLQECCGYEGVIFLKKEKEMQKIRKLKEEIIHYETMLKKDKSVQRIIDHHKAYINKYKQYGSEDW